MLSKLAEIKNACETIEIYAITFHVFNFSPLVKPIYLNDDPQ